jgi:hypothetical protein
MGAERAAWLALVRRAYVAHDLRWPLLPPHARRVVGNDGVDNEVVVIVALRRKGRICAGAVGVPGVVVGRKLRARGIDTGQVTTSGLWCSVWCCARPPGPPA